MNKILITGRPGSGKTTIIQNLVAPVTPVAGGFLTEEIREGGRRVGFGVRDIHSGSEGILAHVAHRGGPRVGKYGVDVASFERIGVGALREAMSREGCVFIDEIGKMELCSSAFREVVSEVMDSARPVVATVPLFQHPFLDSLRGRKDVRLVEVTKSNRDELAECLVALLGRTGSS